MGRIPLDAWTAGAMCASSGSSSSCSTRPSSGCSTPKSSGRSEIALCAAECRKLQLLQQSTQKSGGRTPCRRKPLVDSPSYGQKSPCSSGKALPRRKIAESQSVPACLRQCRKPVDKYCDPMIIDTEELDSPISEQQQSRLDYKQSPLKFSGSGVLESGQRKGFAGKLRESVSLGVVSRNGVGQPGSPNSDVPAFETWCLESGGGAGAVRISEFAAMRRLTAEDGSADGYKRPSNKRDLGHHCKYCRKPFSSLGAELVAQPETGPTQRFHPECWRKHNNCDQESIHGGLASVVKRNRSQVSGGDRRGDVVMAYADAWKRTSAASPSKRSLRRSERRARECVAKPRVSPLDGLISVEDECGQRQVARGFSKEAVQAAEVQWRCTAAEAEECAVCLAHPEQPLRLPCGHIFCSQCVAPWLKRCSLCPLCRKDLHQQGDALAGIQAVSTAHAALPSTPPPTSINALRRPRGCK